MGILQTLTVRTFWKIIVVCMATAVVVDCGSTTQSSPTEESAVNPTPTFQTIQVTVPSGETPTPEPTADEAPSTRGGARAFPDFLKTPEGVTVGPLISTWQTYLDNGVMVFDDNVLDLCRTGRGTAVGQLMNGNILWTLGPPTYQLEANELFLGIWNPDQDIGAAVVLGFEDNSPVVKPISHYDQYGGTPFEYVGNPFPFEMYELTNCINSR